MFDKLQTNTESLKFTTSLIRATDLDRSTVRTVIGSMDGIKVEGGGLYTIATGVTAQALSLGGVTTGTVLYLSTTMPITAILNGSPIPIGVDTQNEPGILLFTNTAITSVAITNASGSAAYIDFFIAGV
jgi:hypothetical protein